MHAIGVQDHPLMKLGLQPATPAKPRLKLRNYLLSPYPVAVDHLSGIQFGLYTNDRFGVCGPTAVANSRRLITAKLSGQMVAPSLDDVYDLYRRSGNPNFNPNTGQGDNGVNMQKMLQAVNSGGIGGTKCLGFASVDPSNIDELKAAIAIFGFVLFGVNLQVAQQMQTRQGVWDYIRSSPWGGHAILGGKYQNNPEGIDVVTWAQFVRMTDEFMLHQESECWVAIWPEHLRDNAFLQGVNLASFAADYESLTGRKFPAVVPTPPPIPPAPVPPVPVPPTPVKDTRMLESIGTILGFKSSKPAKAGDQISFS